MVIAQIVSFFTSIFFRFSPVLKFKVSGNSMLPEFKRGDVLLVWRWVGKHKGDVVVAGDPRDGRFILKRIEEIEGGRYFLIGDNPAESTDSRKLGWIAGKNILGRVVWKMV